MAVDRHDDLFGGQSQFARSGVEDAGIGLVGDDPVDIGGDEASGIEDFA